ncbi:hypothetical protein G6N74_25260 [Mesorhizobium sp. CGMCC 1.15528]|uniref:MAPEG family protein n=1 Tax=Mesorhizobium zhangyense TaxID=1776730 RepID=A0A7C9VCZ7_9HYPH|nr:MAPEG family protein [Mesorhizobium zhangyense]NGN44386.1 hypothetical protein [Mesorhizobium zhangyense]
MNPTAIFWPVIAHVVLVYIVYAVVGKRRYNAVQSGEAKTSQFRGRTDEPSSSATASNNLMNQFELPILFHVVCLALFVTSGVAYVPVVLAWLFAISRYVHAWVHLTGNRIRYRQPAFSVGFFALAALWIWFALHLLAVV